MTEIPERTYRLIPSKYPPINAFDLVARAADLELVIELEGWTNDRLVAERLQRLPEAEWVFGVPNASVVMAAFLHASPEGSRFSGPDLGAWYASLDLPTAIAEVAHHLRREAWNTGRREYSVDYRAYVATLRGDYEDIRGQRQALAALYHPSDYAASQAYGEARRAAGNDGILYESVRLRDGLNAVAYRPSNVAGVAQANHWRITAPVDGPPSARRLNTI